MGFKGKAEMMPGEERFNLRGSVEGVGLRRCLEAMRMVREEEMTSLCCWRRSIWGSETRSLRKSGEKGINSVCSSAVLHGLCPLNNLGTLSLPSAFPSRTLRLTPHWKRTGLSPIRWNWGFRPRVSQGWAALASFRVQNLFFYVYTIYKVFVYSLFFP